MKHTLQYVYEGNVYITCFLPQLGKNFKVKKVLVFSLICCCKYGSNDFHALHMRELKLEVSRGLFPEVHPSAVQQESVRGKPSVYLSENVYLPSLLNDHLSECRSTVIIF